MFASFDDIARKLTSDQETFAASVEMFSGPPQETSFRNIFHLEDEELNKYGLILVDWMNIQGETRKYLCKLHWLSRAFIQFQDVLSLTLMEVPKDSNDLTEILGRHHCYYEALVYLRSGILSLVNMNANSTITMLRPVCEQFVYSTYWDIIQDEGDITRYNAWLRTKKGKPTFKDAMNKIESELKHRHSVISNRISKIKTGIMQGYKIL